MTTWEYRPGPFVAVVAGSAAVLIDVPAGEPLARELLECLGGDPTIEDLVEVLLGQGLRRLGSFAAATIGPSGARVVVRGDFSATLPGEEPLVGSGLWADRTFAGGTEVSLVGVANGAASLPIGQGIVLASSIAATTAERPATMDANDESAADQPVPARFAPASMPDEVLASLPEPEPSALPEQDATMRAPEHVPAASPMPDVPPAEPPAPGAPAAEPAPREPAEPRASVAEPRADVTTPTPAAWPWQPTATAPPAEAGSEPVPPPVAEPATPSDGPGGLLIESFPWAQAPGPDHESAPPPPVAPLAAVAPLHTPLPASAPRLAPTRSVEPDQEAMEMTVDRSRLIEHSVTSTSSVLVVAARCPAGHLSPAYADGCRVCRQPIPPQQPVEVPRPKLGVLRLSNGDTVALDRGAILGRNPRLPAGYSGEQPNLVRLSDPGKDISSQHLEVVLDYWHVLVTDLGSTNGTEVILPGQAPIQLRADDPMTIEPGTRVVLAGMFDFVFEVVG